MRVHYNSGKGVLYNYIREGCRQSVGTSEKCNFYSSGKFSNGESLSKRLSKVQYVSPFSMYFVLFYKVYGNEAPMRHW